MGKVMPIVCYKKKYRTEVMTRNGHIMPKDSSRKESQERDLAAIEKFPLVKRKE